jgi:CHAT domain-containing protein
VLNHLPAATCCHLSTHGDHDELQPANSALTLADGKLKLALLRDARLAAARLVFLSACESGLAGVRRLPEEFIGLASGFVQAGAACTVGSLWPVSSAAAFLLATRFYELLLDTEGRVRLAPAVALREAQDWLRTLKFEQLRQMFPTDESGRVLLLHATMKMQAVDELPLELPLGADHEQPYAAPNHWAAFTCMGA